MGSEAENRGKRILDEVVEFMRLHHYSIHISEGCIGALGRETGNSSLEAARE